MSVCQNCQKASDNLVNSFTRLERLHLLAAAVAMARSVRSGRNDADDVMVSSSVITKLMLSFPAEARSTLLEHFKRSVQMEITLGSCPHSIEVLA